jgi:hypothetical protein
MNCVAELAEGAGGAASAVGYRTVQPRRPANYDKRVIRFEWLTTRAAARYTVSRPSPALNPDTGGGELTDGGIIRPAIIRMPRPPG